MNYAGLEHGNKMAHSMFDHIIGYWRDGDTLSFSGGGRCLLSSAGSLAVIDNMLGALISIRTWYTRAPNFRYNVFMRTKKHLKAVCNVIVRIAHIRREAHVVNYTHATRVRVVRVAPHATDLLNMLICSIVRKCGGHARFVRPRRWPTVRRIRRMHRTQRNECLSRTYGPFRICNVAYVLARVAV